MQDASMTLKTTCHWNKLKKWSFSKEVVGVIDRVKRSGLSGLTEHNYKAFDYVAIQAFVERWQPDTNTFHLPFGEVTITLNDVRTILGVPVEGTCCNGAKSKIKGNKYLENMVNQYG